MSDESLGVLQLLNATDSEGNFGPFSDGIIPLIEALASQASVAMENRALLDEQEARKQQLEREVDVRTEELKDALTRLSEAHIILKEMNTIDAATAFTIASILIKTLSRSGAGRSVRGMKCRRLCWISIISRG